MNIHRIYNWCVTIAIVICAFILMSLLSGCHTFTLKTERCSAEHICTKVDLKTRLESEKEVSVQYNAETKAYDINLGEATKSNIDPVAGAFIVEIMKMMRSLSPVPSLGVPQ